MYSLSSELLATPKRSLIAEPADKPVIVEITVVCRLIEYNPDTPEVDEHVMMRNPRIILYPFKRRDRLPPLDALYQTIMDAYRKQMDKIDLTPTDTSGGDRMSLLQTNPPVSLNSLAYYAFESSDYNEMAAAQYREEEAVHAMNRVQWAMALKRGESKHASGEAGPTPDNASMSDTLLPLPVAASDEVSKPEVLDPPRRTQPDAP